MADACQHQLRTDEAAALGFEERFGLLVDAEWTAREQRKLDRRLRTAKLRHPATLEAVDFTHPRRLNRQQVLTLGTCAWIAERHNLIVTGACGIGKSFLACAFVERACRRGFTARYVRMPSLLHELAVGRGDGSYARLLVRLTRFDLLAIDDWMLAPLRDAERRDLTEVIEDRAERASTLIASQLPVTDWHAVIGGPNQADAICDRLLHDAHRIELKGRSMRRAHRAPKTRLSPPFPAPLRNGVDNTGGVDKRGAAGAPPGGAAGRRVPGPASTGRRTVAATPPRRAARRFAPTGVGSAATTTKSASSPRTAARVESQVITANRMGGTDRSTSLRSDERSTSPKSVFHIPGMRVPLHRNTHETRHINVVVEQVRYRPRSLTAIRQLAGCLVRGERVPGRTTAQQLTHAYGGGANVVTGERLHERGSE